MYGVMEFYKECLKSNIKPIIGLELIIDDELFILYAKNYFGYQNLTRIVYVMQNEKITYDVLKKFCDNLICVATINNYEMLSNIYDDIYNKESVEKNYFKKYENESDIKELRNEYYELLNNAIGLNIELEESVEEEI